MAEAFARRYGSDVIVASSAGLSPAAGNHPSTRAVMLEKNIDVADHVPRSVNDLDLRGYDLIVNMSGSRLPENLGVPVETWDVKDPIGCPDEVFRSTREDIEMRVMQLILRIRTGKFDAVKKCADSVDSGHVSSRQ